MLDEPGINCSYAKSDKHWVTDPQGIAWEAYHTLDSIPYFDGDTPPVAAATAGRCCQTDRGLAPAQVEACCAPAATPITFRSRSRA